MPGYNTPAGTPHHAAKSPAQDSARTSDYSRAHFDSVFSKQQDSGGMLYHILHARCFCTVLSMYLFLVSFLCSFNLLFVVQMQTMPTPVLLPCNHVMNVHEQSKEGKGKRKVRNWEVCA
jgi:hypothetical protein